jgi:hypothetical protein
MISLLTFLWIASGAFATGIKYATNEDTSNKNAIAVFLLGTISLFFYIGFILTKKTYLFN